VTYAAFTCTTSVTAVSGVLSSITVARVDAMPIGE
jgi:hypothetical protein